MSVFQDASDKQRWKVSGLAIGWAGVLAIFVAWLWYGHDPEGHSGSWGGVTLAATAVSAGLIVLVAVGARRDAGSGRAPVAFVLAVVLWFMGVLVWLAVAFVGFGTACEGTSAACSWECLNQSGSSWQALSALCVVVVTVAVPVLLTISRDTSSRLVGRTAPALVLTLFMLAVLLDAPHGTNTHCDAAALSRPCGAAVTTR
jgi:hypothetical protein